MNNRDQVLEKFMVETGETRLIIANYL